jgi:hypothetical protein
MDNPNPPPGPQPRRTPPPPYIQQQQGPGTSPGMTRPLKVGDPVTVEAPPVKLADLASLVFNVTEVSSSTHPGNRQQWIILERQDAADPRTSLRTTITTSDPALLTLEAGHTLTFTADGAPTAGKAPEKAP